MNPITVHEVGPAGLSLSWAPAAGTWRVLLAPEPPRSPDRLPAVSVPLLEVDASLGRVRLDGLAPGTRAWITVDDGAERQSVGVALPAGVSPLHPLTRVQAVGRDLLALTLGARARTAPQLRVHRRDGREIVGQTVVHGTLPRVYLRLAEPLGEPDVLTLELAGPRAARILVPWSDRYLEALSIQVNRHGYLPAGKRRYAYAGHHLGAGGPLSLDGWPRQVEVLAEEGTLGTRRVVAVLGLDARSAKDPGTGCPVRQVDLASVAGERLCLRVAGVGVSPMFAVSDTVGPRLLRLVAARVTDRRHLPGTPGGPRGHADGPEGPQPVHLGVATALLRAWESQPGAFADGQLDVPERRNLVPDVIDEALWGLAGWELGPNGLVSVQGVPSPDFTARHAAVLAHAARLLRPIHSELAEGLARRAVRAFAAARRGDVGPAALAQATGELSALLRNDALRAEFASVAERLGLPDRLVLRDLEPTEWGREGPAGVEQVLEGTRATPAVAARVVPALEAAVAGLRRSMERSAWRALPGPEPLRQLAPAAALRRLTGADVTDLLSLALDQVLGANPTGESVLDSPSPGIWRLEAPLLLALAALLAPASLLQPGALPRPPLGAPTDARLARPASAAAVPAASLRPTPTLLPDAPTALELTPAIRLVGVGPRVGKRLADAGILTIGELAAARPGEAVPEALVRRAQEAVTLARELTVPAELGGLRFAEVLGLPLSEDEAVTRFQVSAGELAERLERRWFGRLRSWRVTG